MEQDTLQAAPHVWNCVLQMLGNKEAVVRLLAPLQKVLPEHERVVQLVSARSKMSVDFAHPFEYLPFVQAFKDREVKDTLSIITVSIMMASTYVSFHHIYMPAVGMTMISPASVFFHSTFTLACWSYHKGVVTDPGGIPEEFRAARDEGHLFQDICNERKKTTGELRYCNKELKFKPDRAHYSSSLKKNVLRMDHYCPYLNNAVGFKNHKFFLLFIFHGAASSALVVIKEGHLLFTGFKSWTAIRLFMLAHGFYMGAIMTSFLTPFTLFHLWLLARNMTTIEYFEKLAADESRASLYDIGTFQNIQAVLGSNPLQWMLPVGCPIGDGTRFPINEATAKGESTDDPDDEEVACALFLRRSFRDDERMKQLLKFRQDQASRFHSVWCGTCTTMAELREDCMKAIGTTGLYQEAEPTLKALKEKVSVKAGKVSNAISGLLSKSSFLDFTTSNRTPPKIRTRI